MLRNHKNNKKEGDVIQKLMQDAANILKSVVRKNDWCYKRLVPTLSYVTGNTERSWHPRRD